MKTYDKIFVTDCHYIRERLTASFLLLDLNSKNENIIIETGHGKAVGHILESMKTHGVAPESISHIFISHVHLDHSGGVGALLSHCPNAVVVCHPRARLHLANPERLIKGSIAVYGEVLYKSLYGEILPIDNNRIIEVEDNEIIEAGGRKLQCLHTAGHARHHICIYDQDSGTVFTGDTFGLAYPDLQKGSRKFIYPATTPSDFDIAEARKSVERILELKPRGIWLTHFGLWDDPKDGAEQLFYALDEIEKIQNEANSLKLTGDELSTFCYDKLKNFVTGELKSRGMDLTPGQFKDFNYDIKINSMGIAYSIEKNNKNISR